MRVQFSEYGRSLGTRGLARKLRPEIEAALDRGEHVEFDFEGIDMVASSFADELFAKLAERVGFERFKEHFSMLRLDPLVRDLVRGAIVTRRRRLAEPDKDVAAG